MQWAGGPHTRKRHQHRLPHVSLLRKAFCAAARLRVCSRSRTTAFLAPRTQVKMTRMNCHAGAARKKERRSAWGMTRSSEPVWRDESVDSQIPQSWSTLAPTSQTEPSHPTNSPPPSTDSSRNPPSRVPVPFTPHQSVILSGAATPRSRRTPRVLTPPILLASSNPRPHRETRAESFKQHTTTRTLGVLRLRCAPLRMTAIKLRASRLRSA